MKHTEIAQYGEFGLIQHLTQKLKLQNQSSLKGIGDDAAVLDYKEKHTLITTDLLLEGIHFDLTYTPLKHLGYKAAVVNFSDIYAMNGLPKQITVSLGISKKFSVEMLEELYQGLILACENYQVDIVGGDTSASMTGLTISITCIGEANEENIVYRNGAKENDLVCVTGNLGAAYCGLQVLEREKIAFQDKNTAQPNLQEYTYILQRQLKPEARKDIVQSLAQNNIKPTAMMDISDGLSSELIHICKQSQVGCHIYEDKIPINFESVKIAEELNLNIVTLALNGGEDYELLFTADIADYEQLAQMDDVHIIGHITKPTEGLYLLGREGEKIPLKAQGWNSLS